VIRFSEVEVPGEKLEAMWKFEVIKVRENGRPSSDML
jgi:hypothetical protein